MGACLYHPQNGVEVSNLPAIFKVARLENIGRDLVKLLSAGRVSLEDATDLLVHFEESIIVARQLAGGTLIFAICETDCNQNMLQMSFRLLEEGYRKEAGSAAPTPEVAAVPEPEPVAGGAEEAPEELIELLRDALAPVVGPMADLILDDAVEEWMEGGASAERKDD